MTSQLVSNIHGLSLPNLKTIKLRHLALGDSTIASISAVCSMDKMVHLDLSFTNIRFLSTCFAQYGGGGSRASAPVLNLEKLNLGSTSVSLKDLETTLPLFTNLRVLSLSALQPSTTGLSSMTDDSLRSLTRVLSELKKLEKINLARNEKLCRDAPEYSAMSHFLTVIGRRLKVRRYIH